MTTKQATHYVVVCAASGRDGQVCPRRATDIDVWLRAVRAFERPGWHQDIDQSHRTHDRNDQRT